MNELHFFVIGFGRPDLLIEQKRLSEKYVTDPYQIHLVDNSRPEYLEAMQGAARELGVEYLASPSANREHPEALNYAAEVAKQREYEFFMFLDHDVFPRREARVIPYLETIGFYGIGQYHSPTDSQYIWPGLFGVSREWLNKRELNFNGVRGEQKRDDGDCGSMNHTLFAEEDWKNLHGVLDHGYGFLRAPDAYGLQSFGYEQMGPWLHLTNSSHWMEIPDPEERDRLALTLIQGI